jgi:hypothetical protein
MEMEIAKSRRGTIGRVVLVGVVGVGLALVTGASASARPAATAKSCVFHEIYQQQGTIDADADGETCGEYGTPVELDVYRNGVLVAAISGGKAPYYQYNCVTTEPTVWSTNWDPPQTFFCG